MNLTEQGMRIVYDLKKDAIPNIVLNHLYKYTQLQSSFGVNNIALVKGRPQTLNLKRPDQALCRSSS